MNQPKIQQTNAYNLERYSKIFGIKDVIIYTDDTWFSARDGMWIQESFDDMVDLFGWFGLQENAANTKVII